MTDTATAPEPTVEGRPLARFGFQSVIEDHPEWRRLFGMDGWNDSPQLAEPEPAPEPAAATVVDQPAAEAPEPEPAEDPAPALSPIAELALSRFEAAHAAEDERTATTQLAAVGDDTEVAPATTEDHRETT